MADGDVDTDMAALDLVAQAEHDPQARTFFITPDPDLADRVAKALDEALVDAGRREIVDAALDHTKAVLVRDLDQAAEVVNDLASEHLQLLMPEPHDFLPKVRNAGAIFLGRWTAVPFGDYGVASNHVLPTAGTARFSSGLRASDYVTVSSVVAARQGERGPVRARHVGDRERRRPRWSRQGHGRPGRCRRGRGTVTPAAEPRAGVRDVDPYVSPQLDVAARLNTNECPHPLPDGFFVELADAVRDLPLNRYPDGQMTVLREDLAAHHGHTFEGTWTANGANEVLTELLLAYGGPGSAGDRVRADVPSPLTPLVADAHRARPAQTRPSVLPRRRGDRRGARRRSQRRVRLLPQQPDRHRAPPRGGRVALRPHDSARRGRRGLHRVRRRERAEARGRSPERGRRAHVLEGVRDGGRATRVRDDEPRRRRRPAAGAASVSHVGSRSGGGDRRVAPPGRSPRAARRDPGPTRPASCASSARCRA